MIDGSLVGCPLAEQRLGPLAEAAPGGRVDLNSYQYQGKRPRGRKDSPEGATRLAACRRAPSRPRRSCFALSAFPRPTASSISTRSRREGPGQSPGSPQDEVPLRRSPRAALPVELLLHEGRGDLHTVPGHSSSALTTARARIRTGCGRAHRSRGGAPPLRRAGGATAAFHALTRFLDLLDDVEAELPAQPALEPPSSPSSSSSSGSRAISRPDELRRVRRGEAACRLLRRAGGAVCRECSSVSLPLTEEGSWASARSWSGRSPSPRGRIEADASRQCLRVIESSYEEHGGFRLRTLFRLGRAGSHTRARRGHPCHHPL